MDQQLTMETDFVQVLKRKGQDKKASHTMLPVNSVEKALIWAINNRYSLDTNADLNVLQVRYSNNMKQITRLFPGNADVWTLYADALDAGTSMGFI